MEQKTKKLVCVNCFTEFSRNRSKDVICVQPAKDGEKHKIPLLHAVIAFDGKPACDDCLTGAAVRLARESETRRKNIKKDVDFILNDDNVDDDFDDDLGGLEEYYEDDEHPF